MLIGVAVIFAIDTFAPLDIEIAVLYAVVVIASADFLGRRGILLVCAVCVLQTLLSYAIVHFDSLQSGPVLRALIGLCAIGIATLAALRNRKAAESLSDQAALLDLTHDAIFVRDRNSAAPRLVRGKTGGVTTSCRGRIFRCLMALRSRGHPWGRRR